MAARSLWKGFLRINLVSVPVKAYAATSKEASEVRLNQLHAECKSRIKYRKTCPIHGEVTNDEIVSGYEYDKDQYVVVSDEELGTLFAEDEKAIKVSSFVPPETVSDVHLSGKNYYLLPDGPPGQKAYQVICQGLLEADRVAVAHLVMHGKDLYAVIRPVDGLLMMATLNYAEQITAPSAFEGEIVKAAIEPEELRLVNMLIKSSSKPKLDVTEFKDHYTERLMALIEKKVAGEDIVTPPAHEPAQVINLMDALKKSIELTQKKAAVQADNEVAAREVKKPARKMAPSKGPKTEPPAKKRKSS